MAARKGFTNCLTYYILPLLRTHELTNIFLRIKRKGHLYMESIQLLNTAIIKSKEKKINSSYEERLTKINNSPAIEAINKSISLLAESQKISRDQAALQVIDAIRELDSIWSDYVTMEGIDRLKAMLQGNFNH